MKTYKLYIDPTARTVIDDLLNRLSVANLTQCINDIVEGKIITLVGDENSQINRNAEKLFNKNRAQIEDTLMLFKNGFFEIENEEATDYVFDTPITKVLSNVKDHIKLKDNNDVAKMMEWISLVLMMRDTVFTQYTTSPIGDTHEAKQSIYNELEKIIDLKGKEQTTFNVYKQTSYHAYTSQFLRSIESEKQRQAAVIMNDLIASLGSMTNDVNGEAVELVEVILKENFNNLLLHNVLLTGERNETVIKKQKSISRYKEMIKILQSIKLQTAVLSDSHLSYIEIVDSKMFELNEVIHSINVEKLKEGGDFNDQQVLNWVSRLGNKLADVVRVCLKALVDYSGEVEIQHLKSLGYKF